MHGFQIVSVIPAHQSASGGACYFCHTGQRKLPDDTIERVLDTGIEIVAEGTPFMCESCVAHAARLFGWITSEEADALRAEVQSSHEYAETEGQRADAATTEADTIKEAVKLLELPVPKSATKPPAKAAATA